MRSKKGEFSVTSLERPTRPALTSGFCSMKRLGLYLLPPGWVDGMLVHDGVTLVGRGTVGVKCLAQEHNTMSPVRARSQTTRSGVKHSNHEATSPLRSNEV